MSFLRYPKYKVSGVEWLGEVPAHWEVVKVRWLCEIKKRIVGELGFDVLSITQKGIRVKDTESNDGQLSMDYTKYQLVEVGDFAMNHMDLLTGYVDLSSIVGVTSPDYRVFSIRDPSVCHPKYVLYLLQNGYLNKVFFAFGQGSSQLGRWRLPTDQFNDFWFPLPSPEEQCAIATFLDNETAKIDALVAEQEKLIALLQEKRQAVISHAVTKGLDPNAPMKDSGVEWLGEVPRHWQVSKISRFFQIKAGGDLKEEFFSAEKDEVHPYPIYTNSNKTGAVYGYTSAPFFDANTITVTGRGEVGFAVYRDCQYDAIIRLLVLSPKNGEYCKFAAYFINSAIVFFGGSTAVAQLSSEQISPYIIFDPPIEEKIKIVEFLDSESNRTYAIPMETDGLRNSCRK